MALTGAAAENIDDFRYLLALVFFVATCDGVLNTVAHVVTQDFFFSTAQSCPHGGNLSYNINAVTVFLNHAAEAPDLPLDAVEPFQYRGFCFFVHG